MKRIIASALALMTAVVLMIAPAAAEKTISCKIGMLSLLKMSEEEAAASLNASAIALRKLNLHHQIETRLDEETENFYLNSDNEVVYFDTLEAMLMALNAGDIDFMRIYSTVADYLCERNENLIQLVVWDKPEKTDCSAVPVYKNLLQNDFAFMMLEGKEALREEYRTGPGGQLRPGHCSGQRRRGRCILDPRQYSSV